MKKRKSQFEQIEAKQEKAGSQLAAMGVPQCLLIAAAFGPATGKFCP